MDRTLAWTPLGEKTRKNKEIRQDVFEKGSVWRLIAWWPWVDMGGSGDVRIHFEGKEIRIWGWILCGMFG